LKKNNIIIKENIILNDVLLFYKNLTLKVFLNFCKLNLYKLLFIFKYRSAKDVDRLLFEIFLCKLSSKKKNILYVGLHPRSFVYQKVFLFDFIDYDNTYLLNSNSHRFFCKDISDHHKEYDIVILSGILNYGTNSDKFMRILEKKNFKSFIIHDWIKNLNNHKWIDNKSVKIHILNKTFWYKFEL